MLLPGQDALEDGGRLLVEDEVGLLREFGAHKAVADELVGVGGHEGGDFGVDVEEDTVHHRAELLFGGGVDGVADAVEQGGGGDDHAFGNLTDDRKFREVGRVEAGDLRGAAGPHDIHHGTAFVHAEGKGLVGELLEGVGQEFGRHGRGAFFGHLADGKTGLERGFTVGGGDGKGVVLKLEEVVFQDGVGGFGDDDLRDGHQAGEQFGT